MPSNKPAADAAADQSPVAEAETAAAEAEAPAGFVWMTVTKKGAGHVHTGSGVGETHKRGDRILAPLETAHSLEGRAFAEADGDLPPLPVADEA